MMKEPMEKKCARCGAELLCYAGTGKGCWCEEYSLSRETLKYLQEQYEDCLCEECLKSFAEKPEKVR